MAPTRTERPILEREAELALLSHAVDQAAHGTGALVLIHGEAGIGKSSLLREFARRSSHARLLIGSCDPLETPLPLGPLFDMAGELGPAVQERLDTQASAAELFRTLVATLTTARPPLVPAFEDVHWADQATLDVLRLFGRRAERLPAVCLATFRDEEHMQQSGLSMLLSDLATSPHVLRVPLAPLSRQATRELAVGTPVDPEQLFELTAGNPFFITEALAAGGQGVPSTVRDAVRGRLARLSDPGRAAMRAAAALGRRFEAGVLAGVLDARGIPRWAVRDGVSSGMLRWEGSQLAFRHVLAQMTLAEDAPADEVQALHATVLSVLRDRDPSDRNAALLVEHAEAAGDVAAVLEYAPKAAARAAALNAHREAAALYGRAVAHAQLLSKPARADLLERRADQLYLAGQMEQALQAHREAAELLEQLGDRLGHARNLNRVAALSFVAGAYDLLEATDRQVFDALTALPPSRELAAAYESRSRRSFMSLDPDRAEEWALHAEQVSRAVDEPDDVLSAQVAVAGARLLADRDDARDALRELLKIARERGLDDLSARIILYLGWLPILHRRYDGVAAYLDEGLAYADRRGLGYWHSMVAGARVRLALDQGRWHAVEAQAEQVLADPDVPSLSKLTVLVARARLRARRGDSSAWPCLDEAMDMALAHHNVEAVTCAWPARVEALWLAGRSSEAAGEARRALASGIGLQNKWWVGELTWVSQCCGERLAVVHPVAEPYALALAGDWRAAAAWWDGHGCPYETGVSLASGDDADDARRGLELLDRLGASAAAGWARGRLRSLGVAAVPRGPRAATRSNPAGLSARERQVLSLAAAGCSNGEISARLFLSLKTVERHLTNGFAKLGATSRLDAVAEARRRGAL